MIPVADALAQVLAKAAPLPPVTVPLVDALGHFLAADVVATEPLPPFRASVMDGYAVQAADGPGEYRVLGHVTAGHIPAFTVTPGTAAYITTGAQLPEGADAVVIVEDSVRLGDGEDAPVRLARGVAVGENVRPIGYDIAVGQTVLAAGERLGAAEIGLLATVGKTEVVVHPRPKVAIFSTGDELVEPGESLQGGQIRDTNRPLIVAAIAAAGGIPVDLGVARDERDQIDAKLRRGLAEADIVLSSGGASVGGLDLIKPLLAELGEIHFGRLLMKPGKPCTFATTTKAGRTQLLFGLPGNPVSSLATYYLLVVPAIRKLAGRPDPALSRVQVQLAQTVTLDKVRPEYHRATLHWEPTLNDGHGGFLAESTGRQVSSRLLSMRTANALLELPSGERPIPAGTVVTALLIGEV